MTSSPLTELLIIYGIKTKFLSTIGYHSSFRPLSPYLQHNKYTHAVGTCPAFTDKLTAFWTLPVFARLWAFQKLINMLLLACLDSSYTSSGATSSTVVPRRSSLTSCSLAPSPPSPGLSEFSHSSQSPHDSTSHSTSSGTSTKSQGYKYDCLTELLHYGWRHWGPARLSDLLKIWN